MLPNTLSPLFSSKRERRLWLWVAVVVTGIYSTLWLAGIFQGVVSNRELVDASMFFSFIFMLAMIVATGLTKRPTLAEIWLTLGVTGAYGMLVFRLGGSAAERTHLFEYGLVAVLIFQALVERRHNGRQVPVPAVLAWGVTSLIGCIDERIQALLPSRVFDPIDIGFNTLAALMTIVASVVIIRVRRWLSRKRE